VVLTQCLRRVFLMMDRNNAALTSCQQKLVMPTRLVEEAMDMEPLLKPLAGPQALLLANLEMEATLSVLLIKFAAEFMDLLRTAAPLEIRATLLRTLVPPQKELSHLLLFPLEAFPCKILFEAIIHKNT